MGATFGFIGMMGFIGCAVWLITLAIKKQKKKVCLICMLASVALFVVGVETSTDEVPAAASSQSSKMNSSSSSISSSRDSSCNSSDSSCAQTVESVQQEENSEQSSSEDGYITKKLYDKIKTGMTYDEVKSIVGSKGEPIYESGDKGTENYVVDYMWNGEDGFSKATITCTGKNQKVFSKSQGGLK